MVGFEVLRASGLCAVQRFPRKINEKIVAHIQYILKNPCRFESRCWMLLAFLAVSVVVCEL